MTPPDSRRPNRLLFSICITRQHVALGLLAALGVASMACHSRSTGVQPVADAGRGVAEHGQDASPSVSSMPRLSRLVVHGVVAQPNGTPLVATVAAYAMDAPLFGSNPVAQVSTGADGRFQ